MDVPYFYEPDIDDAEILTLSEETSKHCIQVLRMKKGEKLKLTNGKGIIYAASILTENKREATVAIENKALDKEIKRRISIAVSLLKNSSRFEWFLEKATEIGVTEIVPLMCERTERQHFRSQRLKNVITSAMLQSQQSRLPVLHDPKLYSEAVVNSSYHTKLIAHCEEEEKKSLLEIELQDSCQLLIGPEGDFSLAEIQIAIQHGFIQVNLGHTRLRTETAGVVASALLVNKS
jgi:16S rRNA (uracil1498-N3)-methyltransferase